MRLQLRVVGLSAILLLLSGNLFAQDGRLKRANAAYENLAYSEAIRHFQKALDKKFDKTAMIRLADCYRLTNDRRRAAEQYSKVVSLHQIDPINYFHFAQSLMNLGMYPEAAKWFDKYALAVPEDPRGAQFAASCRGINAFFADTADVELRPFPHNTEQDEFGPIWYKDGVLFSSSRGEGEVVASKYDWNGQPFLDFYFSKMTGQGTKFSRPVLVKGKLNTRFHEATCAWDSVHQLAYFTRNNFFEGKRSPDANGILNLKLFYADVPPSGPWTNVRSLPFNSDAYSIGHPTVLKGGDVLLYISDMPGGFGGTDIYMSRHEGDAWSPPTNLGPQINSPGNEMFPYLSESGILYFSSDGLGGLGGLDIFSCPFSNLSSTPQNLGAPLNSAFDDFGYLVAADGNWGMLSSNRPGGRGADDIYIFQYQKPTYEAVVLDAATGADIPSAEITLALPAFQRRTLLLTDANGQAKSLVQRNATYQIMVEAAQYKVYRGEASTYGLKVGEVLHDTIRLERPPVQVITKVLDPATGFPILNAQVRLAGTNLTMNSDSLGEVSFYFDPYPTLFKGDLDCPPMQAPNYCYWFTDEGFAEFDTLKLTYEWSFGDGQKARGLEVRHCYDGPGTYLVSLDLLDAAGQVFMNQSTYELEIQPAKGLFFDGPDTVYVGQVAHYSAENTELQDCSIDSYDWSLEGTQFGFSGPTIAHTFKKAGRYTLSLRVGGHGAAAPRACSGCVKKDIVVVPSDHRLNSQQRQDSLRIAWTSPSSQPSTNTSREAPCNAQAPENYCYTLTDEGSIGSDSLPFIYVWDLGDGQKKEGMTVRHCFANPGIYTLRLEILDPLSRQQVATRSEYELDIQDLRQVYVASYDTVALMEEVLFDAFQSDFVGCNVQRVSWNFGDGQTAQGPDVKHAYARIGSYRVELVLEGLDPISGAQCAKCSYKQILVQSDYRGNALRDSIRAASLVTESKKPNPEGTVVLEIEKLGYESKKVVLDPGITSGIAKTEIALNAMTESETVMLRAVDEHTGLPLRGLTIRLQNPDTGLPIQSFQSNDSLVRLNLVPGKRYEILVQKADYLTQVIPLEAVLEGKVGQPIEVRMQVAEVGQTWVLHNLYYDFDKSYIRHDAAIELAKLVVFLKANPMLRVELSAHTDARGGQAYNLELSQARAEAAVAFLRARGIAANRLLAQGYGEQRLTNGCTDNSGCDEAAHQANRRTEIKILGLDNPIYSLARPVEDIWGTASIMIQSHPGLPGPFTVILGTYLSPKPAEYFSAVAGNEIQVGYRQIEGFHQYFFGSYPSYEAANAQMNWVLSKGFANTHILAVPAFTQPTAATEAPEPIIQTENQNKPSFYSVQVAALERSVQQSFLDSFGEYRSLLFEKAIDGRRVFFVGEYASEAEARKYLDKIRRAGHADAFLVHFERGKKTNLDKVGGR